MRQRRLKAPSLFPVAHYHCMSRVVNRDFVFGPQEREHFVRLLRENEGFCGVRVLTYCVLSNRFHLLVEVPARPAQPLNAEEVLARIKGLSNVDRVFQALRGLWGPARRDGARPMRGLAVGLCVLRDLRQQGKRSVSPMVTG